MFPLQPEATEQVAGKGSPHFTNNWYARKEPSPVPWNANPPDEGLIRRMLCVLSARWWG